MKKKSPAEALHEFLAEVGYMWGPSPEIYGGLAGFYTYAPLGKLLKNHIEDTIRKFFQREDFWEVECPTVMPTPVWKASGHLGGFTDPLIRCSKCDAMFRVDKLLEEFTNEQIAGLGDDKLLELINKHNFKCLTCKGEFKQEIKAHSLMMATTVGVDTEAFNRPETATTTYLPFTRYVDFFRKKLPFGVFQIGKAYRNEISPRQHVTRGREFTQAEAQLFLFREQKEDFAGFDEIAPTNASFWTEELQQNGLKPTKITFEEAMSAGIFKNKAYAWSVAQAWKLFLNLGIPEDKMRLRQHFSDEKAFYADDAWDLEIHLNSLGWLECCGIHDRTDYDLKQHAEHSKKNLVAFNEISKLNEAPHILEIAFGTDRPTYALCDLFLEHKDDTRILHLPPKLAPIKCAVFPLQKKPELVEFSEKIHYHLSRKFVCVHELTGSIGKRYARNDEKGTPYCITVDYDSLEDNSVTIRDRDSHDQIRVKIDDLEQFIEDLINEKTHFASHSDKA